MNIGWRQLVVVAAVAVVFGGGAGYLGGNFEWGWVTGDEAQIRPVRESKYFDYFEQQREQALDDIIRERQQESFFEDFRRGRAATA